MTKLSNFVISFIEKITDTIFLLAGGGIMHLVDSVRTSNLDVYCCHHEQAATIAAEGYARIKNKIGVVLVTSGPGATNAITGVAGAWLDSIPLLVISGQVKTDNIMPRKNGHSLIRQMGFQELNIIDMIKPITKYAVTVLDPSSIRYHLEKACYLATNGRPGPVWIEIPLDIQAMKIKINALDRYTPPRLDILNKKIPIIKIVKKLQEAKRPLLMAGNGIRLSKGLKLLWELINKLKINVVTPIFTGSDLINEDYPYFLGRQGMPGNPTANFAVDNCDLLLIIGERMQLIQTSYDYHNFAKNAYIIMADIDKFEMEKKTIQVDLAVHCDAKQFLQELIGQKISLNKWTINRIDFNHKKYQGDRNYVNVFEFLHVLNKYSHGLNIATADAMASNATHYIAKLNKDQRLIVNTGLGHMGSGLPLAIGACIADNKKPTICIEGDGSLMLNIHALQTILQHKLPIKLFIYNNGGYHSIRNTHRRYFNHVFAADEKTGVSIPTYEKLVKAWGFEYKKITNNNQLEVVRQIIRFPGPIVCELMIDPNQPMPPRWTAGDYTENSS